MPQLIFGEPRRLPVIAGLVVVGARTVLGSLVARAGRRLWPTGTGDRPPGQR